MHNTPHIVRDTDQRVGARVRVVNLLLLCLLFFAAQGAALVQVGLEGAADPDAAGARIANAGTVTAEETGQAILDGEPQEAMGCQRIGVYDQPDMTCREDGDGLRCLAACAWNGDYNGARYKHHTADDLAIDAFNDHNDILYDVVAPAPPTELEGEPVAAHQAVHPDPEPEVASTASAAPRFPWAHESAAVEADAVDNEDAPRDASALVPARQAAAQTTGATDIGLVVAGAVTLAAAAAVMVTLAKLLPWARRGITSALALFSRLERADVLKNPVRACLHGRIQQEPGIHLQALVADTDLARGTVVHHLRYLERHGVVRSKTVGRSRHFFVNGGGHDPQQKEAYVLLRNQRNQEVMAFLEQHPGADRNTIGAAMGMSWNLTAWYLKRLSEAGLVRGVKDGRSVAYWTCLPAATLEPKQPSAAIAVADAV